MSKQPDGRLLAVGDLVRIPGEGLSGHVTAVDRHETTVAIVVDGHREHRRYAHESLVLEPTMAEASDFVDH